MRNKKGRLSSTLIVISSRTAKRHEPRLLDRGRELALMLCADVRVARIDDLCLARNEPAQKVDLFIVDVL